MDKNEEYIDKKLQESEGDLEKLEKLRKKKER